MSDERGSDSQGAGGIIMKYARLDAKGRPMFCHPSAAETSRDRRPLKKKVIYPDHASARAAAVELEAINGYPLMEYPCPRSRKGHFHLTTDDAWIRG